MIGNILPPPTEFKFNKFILNNQYNNSIIQDNNNNNNNSLTIIHVYESLLLIIVIPIKLEYNFHFYVICYYI
jgi:hypothetical protein